MKYNLASYKAIVFDFDGVILDSESYKIQTFKSLFSSFPDYIDKIDEYNKANRGISRYDKFRYIYQTILQLPYTEDVEKMLGEAYNSKLVQNLGSISLISGVKKFLEQQHVPLYIASSSKESEMDQAMQAHGIKKYFKKTYDQSNTKEYAILDVKKKLKLKGDKILFVGDAIIDYEIAQKTKVDFLARTKKPDKFPENTKWIADFRELL